MTEPQNAAHTSAKQYIYIEEAGGTRTPVNTGYVPFQLFAFPLRTFKHVLQLLLSILTPPCPWRDVVPEPLQHKRRADSGAGNFGRSGRGLIFRPRLWDTLVGGRLDRNGAVASRGGIERDGGEALVVVEADLAKIRLRDRASRKGLSRSGGWLRRCW